MQVLSAHELLGAWERGLAQGPVERALTLLEVACPESPREELASLSIGRRDASLLTLRELIFGSRIAGLVACPKCGGQLELIFNAADVRADSQGEPASEGTVTLSGCEVQFRLPNSLDLAAVAELPDDSQRRQSLFERCLLAVTCNGEQAPTDPLPVGLLDAVADRMAQADPQAEIRLGISCPLCGHQWHEVFDILSFFWSEIDAWARRLLYQVHKLASAYGWHERDILALSPRRRQLYLEMVGV